MEREIRSLEKTPSDSKTIMTQVVYPNDANPMGMLQGGKLVQWMDTASAICAQTHAERIAVTVSMDNVRFKKPAKIGDIVMITAKATRAFDKSIEIFVQAWSRNIFSNDVQLINEAYFTFVALDDNASPSILPILKPVTKEEKDLYEKALERKKQRL